MSRTTACLILPFALCTAARADGWRLQAEALTDVPVQTGARLKLEMPWRLRVATSLGVLPGPYVDLINGVVVALDGYDQDTADLVRQTIQNSMVWRIHAGWRPFAGYGLYFELGYGLVALGGGVPTEDLISVVTGRTPPPSPPGLERRQLVYDVSSTLHMLDVEIGWQFMLWKGLTLRVAMGLAATLGAGTRMDPQFRPLLLEPSRDFTAYAEDYLNDIYLSYVHTPVISVALGYRFLGEDGP